MKGVVKDLLLRDQFHRLKPRSSLDKEELVYEGLKFNHGGWTTVLQRPQHLVDGGDSGADGGWRMTQFLFFHQTL